MKYIKKLSEKFVYPYEEPQIGKVELWDFSRANESEEAKKEAVCLVASISYGNEYCKDPNKLWNLLIDRGHESPFEFIRAYGCVNDICKAWNFREIDFSDIGAFSVGSVLKRGVATFKLKVPIFVARQIMRHRSFSYMEMSRRYVKGDKVKLEFWRPSKTVEDGTAEAVKKYSLLLEMGLKPEQARAYLPLCLYTQFWMQGDYKALLNFFIHRLAPEAQEETRLVAQAMWGLLKENQPEIVETMTNYLDEWVKDCNPIFIPARRKKSRVD